MLHVHLTRAGHGQGVTCAAAMFSVDSQICASGITPAHELNLYDCV